MTSNDRLVLTKAQYEALKDYLPSWMQYTVVDSTLPLEPHKPGRFDKEKKEIKL